MYKYRFVLLVLVMTTSFLHAQKTGKKWSFYGGFGLNISVCNPVPYIICIPNLNWVQVFNILISNPTKTITA